MHGQSKASPTSWPTYVRRGTTLAFVTNNAARTPHSVAAHLTELGVAASTSDVVTSAQAAAHALARQLGAGSKVLVVGGEGLVVALEEQGLVPVHSQADDPAAVVQGFHPDVGWELLAEAAYTIATGVPWFASNLDLTVPTARGVAPGNGTLVNAVAAAAGRRPDLVAGKPYRPLFDETVERVGAQHPIVVGDRLDTDIEGAVNCDADSLLVMTGVTDVATLCRAPANQRPTSSRGGCPDSSTDHPAPTATDDGWTCRGWRAAVRSGALGVTAPSESTPTTAMPCVSRQRQPGSGSMTILRPTSTSVPLPLCSTG